MMGQLKELLKLLSCVLEQQPAGANNLLMLADR